MWGKIYRERKGKTKGKKKIHKVYREGKGRNKGKQMKEVEKEYKHRNPNQNKARKFNVDIMLRRIGRIKRNRSSGDRSTTRRIPNRDVIKRKTPRIRENTRNI